jgi:hypothetical protein
LRKYLKEKHLDTAFEHYKFLAHLTQRVMWGIAITWRPSSVR